MPMSAANWLAARTSFQFHLHRRGPHSERLEVYGNNGAVIVDQLANPPVKFYAEPIDFDGSPIEGPGIRPDGLALFLNRGGGQGFRPTVVEDRPPTVDPLDCCYAVKVIEKAYESARNGTNVGSSMTCSYPKEDPLRDRQERRNPMIDIKPYLQKMVDRFANPGVQAALKGFTKTLQFKFTDTNESWLIRATNGTSATLARKLLRSRKSSVTITTDILAGIMDKKINGTTAYMQRKIQVKGAMEDLMKLQKLMPLGNTPVCERQVRHPGRESKRQGSGSCTTGSSRWRY